MIESQRNLALVGFRACGKSVLGARIATALGRPFFDLDREIEAAHGRSISRMFAEEGEAWFREVEAGMLAGVIARPGIVIAPGGGALQSKASRQLLRSESFVVYLRVPEADLIERLRREWHRPRLTTLTLEDEVRELLRARTPGYDEAAHRVIDCLPREEIDQTYLKLERVVQEA